MIFVRLEAAAAAAAALLLAAPSSAQPAHIVVQVYSYGFAPKPLQLAAGKPVTLEFVNQSGSSHDFSAREFFAASRLTAGTAPEGEIDLKPHETKSVTLVPRAGTYRAHCSHFFHEQMGMSDAIIVN